jgi:UDP-N-acetyl-D-mannosaminuronate dehydrogenase
VVKPVVLVVGLGEVGRPLFELLKECEKFDVYGWDIDEKKTVNIRQNGLPKKIDVLHICYLCEDQVAFVRTVVDYVKQFKPKLTVINSTIPPRTTEMVHTRSGGFIVHSPVRGMHKSRDSMKRYLLSLTKYIGGVDEESARLAHEHFKDFRLRTKRLKSPVETELAKLFETTYRAWMIACFQEMHRISRFFGANFDDVVDFLEDTHLVRGDRPIHFPAIIGGHCLIPNVNLLTKSYDSQFLRLILKSNEQRKEEIKGIEIRKEVEKIKKRVKALERKTLEKIFHEL